MPFGPALNKMQANLPRSYAFRKTKQNYSVHLADGTFYSLTQAHATHSIVHKGESKAPSASLLPCYMVPLALQGLCLNCSYINLIFDSWVIITIRVKVYLMLMICHSPKCFIYVNSFILYGKPMRHILLFSLF